jgi:hypothetical protein
VDVVFGMNVSKARDGLICKHQDCLEGQFSAAVVEQIFQARTEKLKGHHPKIAFIPIPVHFGDSRKALERFVYIDFIVEMRRPGMQVFKFQSNLLSCFDMMTCIASAGA